LDIKCTTYKSIDELNTAFDNVKEPPTNEMTISYDVAYSAYEDNKKLSNGVSLAQKLHKTSEDKRYSDNMRDNVKSRKAHRKANRRWNFKPIQFTPNPFVAPTLTSECPHVDSMWVQNNPTLILDIGDVIKIIDGDDKSVVIISVSIAPRDGSVGHSNIIIVNPMTHKILYMEPHGICTILEHQLRDAIRAKSTKRWNWDNLDGLSIQGSDSFCQTWVVMMGFMYLLNPNVDMKRMYKDILRTENTSLKYSMLAITSFYIYNRMKDIDIPESSYEKENREFKLEALNRDLTEINELIAEEVEEYKNMTAQEQKTKMANHDNNILQLEEEKKEIKNEIATLVSMKYSRKYVITKKPSNDDAYIRSAAILQKAYDELDVRLIGK
jgi:hypothetical protein